MKAVEARVANLGEFPLGGPLAGGRRVVPERPEVANLPQAAGRQDGRLEIVFEFREASEDRSIVAEGVIAVQFDELVEDQFEIIQRLRPVFVASDLDDVPRREVHEDLALHPRDLDAHVLHGVFGGRRRIGLRFQLRELLFEFEDRFLKRQDMSLAIRPMRRRHRGKVIGGLRVNVVVVARNRLGGIRHRVPLLKSFGSGGTVAE